MQDPNADTEWNDVLRAKGILPPKEEKEITEEDIVKMLENTIEKKAQGKDLSEMNLDELNENEDEIDEEDEKIFEQYRRQRIAEMRANAEKSKFGEVREISKSDWVTEINNAGEGIWVIVHVYKPSVPLCKLLNQHLSALAQKFPQTKFLRSVSSVCIPNYPDKNLPTIFVYYEGDMKKQFVGPLAFGGMGLKQNEVEWMLSKTGAITTDMEEPPRPEVKDVMNFAIRQSNINNDSDDDD